MTDDATLKTATPRHPVQQGQTGPAQADAGSEPAYFDQALFDLHYHLLAVRIQGLPPLPNPEDYGIAVDHLGNVTRIGTPA